MSSVKLLLTLLDLVRGGEVAGEVDCDVIPNGTVWPSVKDQHLISFLVVMDTVIWGAEEGLV